MLLRPRRLQAYLVLPHLHPVRLANQQPQALVASVHLHLPLQQGASGASGPRLSLPLPLPRVGLAALALRHRRQLLVSALLQREGSGLELQLLLLQQEGSVASVASGLPQHQRQPPSVHLARVLEPHPRPHPLWVDLAPLLLPQAASAQVASAQDLVLRNLQ